MRTTEPERWQALLDKVASLSPETIKKFHDQKRFSFLGQTVHIMDKDRYCTVEGLNRQLDEFDTRIGLVYYIDESIMGMAKTGFQKTYEEHYGHELQQPH